MRRVDNDELFDRFAIKPTLEIDEDADVEGVEPLRPRGLSINNNNNNNNDDDYNNNAPPVLSASSVAKVKRKLNENSDNDTDDSNDEAEPTIGFNV
jgi:hypothetical protein